MCCAQWCGGLGGPKGEGVSALGCKKASEKAPSGVHDGVEGEGRGQERRSIPAAAPPGPLTVCHLHAGDHACADRQAVAADGVAQHSHRLLQQHKVQQQAGAPLAAQTCRRRPAPGQHVPGSGDWCCIAGLLPQAAPAPLGPSRGLHLGSHLQARQLAQLERDNVVPEGFVLHCSTTGKSIPCSGGAPRGPATPACSLHAWAPLPAARAVGSAGARWRRRRGGGGGGAGACLSAAPRRTRCPLPAPWQGTSRRRPASSAAPAGT